MKKCVKAYRTTMSYKEMLYDAAESGMQTTILNELLSYISEEDAEDICNTLELIAYDDNY